MTLVNRVSAFFLAALAVVLAIYSGLFYAFVRGHVVDEFERELRNALHLLVAAVEVEPDEVKWQPLEHAISLGGGAGEAQWTVVGDGERLVEQSRNASPEIVARAVSIAGLADARRAAGELAEGDWRILYQRLSAPAPDPTGRELDEFDEIVVVVAQATSRMDADLNRLAILVCLLPLAAWSAAAAAGHWFGRRALQPLLAMSRQVGSMAGGDFQTRLHVSSSRDELAELGAAFNTLLDRQQRAFGQQQRFAGDAAHELRTPLTVLMGQIDVALRRPRTPEDYAATLGVLRDQTSDLKQIVESLLFLARTEDDAVLPGTESIALDKWLERYMDRWDDHLRRGDLRLEIAGRGRTCEVTVSPPLLDRLLDNLVGNAMKYSDRGSPVTITADAGEDEATVVVEDRGRGISAEDQQTIFEPFFRSKEARDAGVAGAGLGLAIAARIAQALGGALTCQSELGRGSRFVLRLPRRK